MPKNNMLPFVLYELQKYKICSRDINYRSADSKKNQQLVQLQDSYTESGHDRLELDLVELVKRTQQYFV